MFSGPGFPDGGPEETRSAVASALFELAAAQEVRGHESVAQGVLRKNAPAERPMHSFRWCLLLSMGPSPAIAFSDQVAAQEVRGC